MEGSFGFLGHSSEMPTIRSSAWQQISTPNRFPRICVFVSVRILHTRVAADRKTYDSPSYKNGYVSLPARVRDLAIDCTALSFVASEKVHFRFKLEGQDTDWREVINSRHVEYSNVAPERSRFLVKASNNSGVWNETGAFLDFSIAPAYYRTTWLRSVCSAVFLVLLWGMYRFRVQQLHQRDRRWPQARF